MQGQSSIRFWKHGSALAALMLVAVILLMVGTTTPATALPSFARQTGQPCGTCHTDYPGLTPYGRLFKLNGYTAGGGPFRTTPFSSDAGRAARAELDRLRGYVKETEAPQPDTTNIWVPPISMMAVFGYTHTQEPQDPDAVAPYKPNDNWTIPQVSLFWGGALTEHVGAFSQLTYDGRENWGWDNQDFRYSNTAMLGSMDVIYGFSSDNNPTMGDPWNTVPAWGFPYMSSNVAPGPAASTLIDGALAQQVGGVGAYAFLDNLVYLQLSGYRSINPDTLVHLGASPTDAPGFIDGAAPYWRAAIEPHWGRNWWEFGTFGMFAGIHPWTGADPDNPFAQSPLTDHYTDVAFDTQYQYQGDNYWLTLRGTYIHEEQSLGASVALGNAQNLSNTLDTTRLYASIAYGNDNRVVLSGQYFNTWGSEDPLLYANNPGCSCSPNSNGYVAEISYIPFINSNSPVWPWANVRVGLQYTYFNKLDGTTVGAQANNTLFLYAWFAM
jgi:hypothetical protein